MENRLADDARQFLLKVAPASFPYLRSGPADWPGAYSNKHKRLIIIDFY